MAIIKKFTIYFIALLFICFILPGLLTVRKKEIINEVSNTETQVEEPYKYQKFSTIKLLHSKTNEIEEIPLDTYLYNVVSAEMPADYELEALKAQAVVARTYTIYQISNSNGKHEGADICDDSTCCQAWISKEDRLAKWDEPVREDNWNKIVQAVDSTAGKIITYDGKPIDAFFHSNSGGKTELPVNVWGGSDFPYLQSVETSGEDGYTQYSSVVTISKEELLNKLKQKHQEVQIDFSAQDSIKILEYTDGGRVRTIKFGNIQISGVEARTLLGLKSANFEVKIEEDNVTFSVKGYGHGVGLSQTGSDSMAQNGSNYEEIIKHFYTNVEIQDINSI
ncbi:MAG: stage II sporulation protein D [Clostridia bacterium]|nr:stage II sporulation protein D [Clostridia bacterium]